MFLIELWNREFNSAMKNNLKSYLNVFMLGVILSIALGVATLVTGYSYSRISGFYRVVDRYQSFLYFLKIGVFWFVLDVVYVQLKCHYRKKGYYKDEKK